MYRSPQLAGAREAAVNSSVWWRRRRAVAVRAVPRWARAPLSDHLAAAEARGCTASVCTTCTQRVMFGGSAGKGRDVVLQSCVVYVSVLVFRRVVQSFKRPRAQGPNIHMRRPQRRNVIGLQGRLRRRGNLPCWLARTIGWVVCVGQWRQARPRADNSEGRDPETFLKAGEHKPDQDDTSDSSSQAD